MEQLLVKELIEATGGRLLQGDPAVRIRHVETDSRCGMWKPTAERRKKEMSFLP